MTRVETVLVDHLPEFLILVFVVLCLLGMIPSIAVRIGRREPSSPQVESLTDRQESLDAQAQAYLDHLPERDGCEGCGDRCDSCEERMCSEYGPEPVITCDSHRLCVDCDDSSHRCTACAFARGLVVIEERA